MEKFPYNKVFQKLPCPVYDLRIEDPDGDKAVTVRVIVDTGADISAFPIRELGKLGRIPTTTKKVRDFHDEVSDHDTVYVNIMFNGKKHEFVQVLKTKGAVGFLGRDVLNEHKLTFDFTNNFWSATKARKVK